MSGREWWGLWNWPSLSLWQELEPSLVRISSCSREARGLLSCIVFQKLQKPEVKGTGQDLALFYLGRQSDLLWGIVSYHFSLCLPLPADPHGQRAERLGQAPQVPTKMCTQVAPGAEVG